MHESVTEAKLGILVTALTQVEVDDNVVYSVYKDVKLLIIVLNKNPFFSLHAHLYTMSLFNLSRYFQI